jgi:hypothetical protein
MKSQHPERMILSLATTTPGYEPEPAQTHVVRKRASAPSFKYLKTVTLNEEG